VALIEPSAFGVPWTETRLPTAMLARVALDTTPTTYLVVDETFAVTVLPAVVVSTIEVEVLLATVPATRPGATGPSR
jgi:hypothetical protein